MKQFTHLWYFLEMKLGIKLKNLIVKNDKNVLQIAISWLKKFTHLWWFIEICLDRHETIYTFIVFLRNETWN